MDNQRWSQKGERGGGRTIEESWQTVRFQAVGPVAAAAATTAATSAAAAGVAERENDTRGKRKRGGSSREEWNR